jgi:hypothetical protein
MHSGEFPHLLYAMACSGAAGYQTANRRAGECLMFFGCLLKLTAR